MIDVDALNLDDGTEAERLMRRLFPIILQQAFDDGTSELGIEVAFDLDNPFVQEVLDFLAEQVRSVAETTKEEIRVAVGQAAAEGWSTEQLRDKLAEMAEIRSTTRAGVIARSETAAAYSRGSILYYKETGVVEGKEWLTADGACEICEPLNGKVVGLDEEFAPGVLHPGAHPDCHCAVAPVLRG